MTVYTARTQAPVAAERQTKKIPVLYTRQLCLVCLFLTAMYDDTRAQCVAPSMSFHSPVLLSGVNNEVGSVYLFPEVMPGVDANIKVTDLVGGAVLYNIDDSAGIGYYDAFQPYVVAPANSVSYLDWEITFKVAGTSNDTALACFAITGVDVDGNGADLQEFIEAATPGSYALDPYTILNFSFDGVRSKAVSQVDNIPLIDTAHREAMFQMNFTNISTLQYRNGAISNHGEDMVRQTCIYFKSFFDNYTLLLPVKLVSFVAQSGSEAIVLKWSATNENDLKYYVVQKSSNGTSWHDLNTVIPGAATANNYFISDAEKNASVVYYRLKQVDRLDHAVYSKILKVTPGGSGSGIISNNTMIKDGVTLQVSAFASDTYLVEVYAINGSRIKQQQVAVAAGFNTTSLAMPGISNGLYVLTVKNSRGVLIHQSKLIRY